MTERRLGLIAIITSCVLWGGSFYFGKIALRELTAIEVVWWRFLLAIALLAPLLALQALRRRFRTGTAQPLLLKMPRRADLPMFVLNALLMVPLQFVLQFEGLARTSASSASLLVGMFAPLMALAGVFIAGERLRVSGWMAVLLSTVGTALMVGIPSAGRSAVGDLMVLGSLFCAVSMVLVTQRLLRRYDALTVTVWSIGIGLIALFPWMYSVGGWPTTVMSGWVWAALAGLGFGCTAATFTLWNWGLRYIPASHAGVFVNIEPLIGAVLGVVLLHDVMNGGLIAGGALILGAALIISWPRPATPVTV